ncbi:MAG: hypothetical protein U9R11_04695 [Chloroflexota bacterium]|nr:hypothetical protein [Chloroflexota bacterium]
MSKVAGRAKSLLFKPGQTLSQRVVRGGFWVFALRIADRLFKLIRTVVLAPGDFGLVGIALLAMSTPASSVLSTMQRECSSGGG